MDGPPAPTRDRSAAASRPSATAYGSIPRASRSSPASTSSSRSTIGAIVGPSSRGSSSSRTRASRRRGPASSRAHQRLSFLLVDGQQPGRRTSDLLGGQPDLGADPDPFQDEYGGAGGGRRQVGVRAGARPVDEGERPPPGTGTTVTCAGLSSRSGAATGRPPSSRHPSPGWKIDDAQGRVAKCLGQCGRQRRGRPVVLAELDDHAGHRAIPPGPVPRSRRRPPPPRARRSRHAVEPPDGDPRPDGSQHGEHRRRQPISPSGQHRECRGDQRREQPGPRSRPPEARRTPPPARPPEPSGRDRPGEQVQHRAAVGERQRSVQGVPPAVRGQRQRREEPQRRGQQRHLVRGPPATRERRRARRPHPPPSRPVRRRATGPRPPRRQRRRPAGPERRRTGSVDLVPRLLVERACAGILDLDLREGERAVVEAPVRPLGRQPIRGRRS